MILTPDARPHLCLTIVCALASLREPDIGWIMSQPDLVEIMKQRGGRVPHLIKGGYSGFLEQRGRQLNSHFVYDHEFFFSVPCESEEQGRLLEDEFHSLMKTGENFHSKRVNQASREHYFLPNTDARFATKELAMRFAKERAHEACEIVGVCPACPV